MPRIVAGAARGRRLTVPAGRGTRPTADRTREALFSAVEAELRSLAGRRGVDLYAGSGAVGLEALSRGAVEVTFVEADPKAMRALRANVATVGLPGADLVAGRVERVVAKPPAGEPYDLVFADPPYDLADNDLRVLLAAALANGWVAADALVVVERATRGGDWRWPDGIEELRARRYGEATLWYGRAGSALQPDGE